MDVFPRGADERIMHVLDVAYTHSSVETQRGSRRGCCELSSCCSNKHYGFNNTDLASDRPAGPIWERGVVGFRWHGRGGGAV